MTNKIPKIRFEEFNEAWNISRIGEFYDFKNGLNKGKESFGYGTPIVNFTDVFNNRGIKASQLKGKVKLDLVEINRYEVRKGDLFFTRTSETIEEIGYPSVMLDGPKNTVFSGFVLRGRRIHQEEPLADIFKKYVFFTNSFRREMMEKSSMTTRALTSGTSIKEMMFSFPASFIEQKKIGQLFTEFDSLIIFHQQKHSKLLATKKAMLEKMFLKEGETVPEIRFEEYSKPWIKKTIGDCFYERIENMPDGELLSVTIDHGIRKFADLNRNDNSNDDKSKYKKVYVGDIAYNSMRMWQGASGYSEYEGIVSPAYTVLAPYEGIDSKAISYLFKRGDMIHTFQLHSQGITSDNWNLKYPALKEIEIYVSEDLSEQEKIGSYFQNLDKLITEEQAKIEKLKNIKLALFEKMFV